MASNSGAGEILSKPGHTRLFDENGKAYFVPNFILPAAKFTAAAEDRKADIDILRSRDGPLSMEDLPTPRISPDGSIAVPPVPALTQRELLGLHSEVKVLQEQYGISYKDAAHRLYHAEILKLSGLADYKAALSDIHTGVDTVIADEANKGEQGVAEEQGEECG